MELPVVVNSFPSEPIGITFQLTKPHTVKKQGLTGIMHIFNAFRVFFCHTTKLYQGGM